MTLLCKQKALYVKTCVIQNGVADFNNDILDSTDIKKIFTSFNNQDSFEIFHNEIPVSEVNLLENYISTDDEVIAGTTVPKGSWIVVIRVDNPKIKEQLLNNEFGGVSLNNRVETRCSTGLEGHITYSELKDAECVIPIYISFVDNPANLVGLHIMDYNVYIQKSKNSEEKEMSLLEKLKALIEAEEKEDSAEIEKSAETTQKDDSEPVEEEEDATEEESDAEPKKDEEEEEKEEPKIEKEAETESESTEEASIEKSADNTESSEVSIEKDANEKQEEEEVEDEIVDPTEEEVDDVEFDVVEEVKKLRAEVDELKAQLEEPTNPVDSEVNAEDVSDEPLITKSARIEVTEEVVENIDDFYSRTGRDRITGKRIRKEKRILN